jgi:hypothetical protein
MRNFYRYLLITLFGFFLLGCILPQWLPIHYPRSLGPVFTAEIRKSYQDKIEKEKPEVVFLGNSVVIWGIDQTQFEQLTNRKTLRLGFMGTASTYWYLLIKSNIATASTPPKYLLLFFLDNMLTLPDQMVNNKYLPIIDEVAGENETVLLQKAYLNQINPVEGFLDSNIPLFGERQTLKDKIDNRLKYSLPQLFQKCSKSCLDQAMDTAFDAKNMLTRLVQNNSISPNRLPDSLWSFNALVEKSFIPDMIQITKKAGIQLILVREKNARVMTLQEESPAMRKYFQDMADYLKKQGIPLIDFSHDPSITIDMFLDEMHLSPQGRDVFTRLVAERFLSLQN